MKGNSRNHQSSAFRFLLAAAAVVVNIPELRAAVALIVPFMLSVFIALICSPPLSWMKSRRVPSGIAVCLIVFFILFIGVLNFAVVGNSVNDFSQDLPFYEAKLTEMLGASVAKVEALGVNVDYASPVLTLPW